MKTLITLIFSILLSNYTIAQANIVSLDFEVDGKQTAYKNATVKFIYRNDTVNTNIKDGKLVIPDMMFKRQAIVIFYIDNYRLSFDSIPVVTNTLYPKWTVGVDKKPFDKKKFWEIKSWKKVQVVYYLNPNDGRSFTVDNCKKSKVITK